MTDKDDPVTEAQLKHALEQERDLWHAKNQAILERWRAENEVNLEHWRAEQQLSLEHGKAQQQSGIEMFRATISFGASSLKTVLIINGGAITLLMALIGHLLSRENVQVELIAQLALSMQWFLFGLIAAVLAPGSAYVAQAAYVDHRNFLGTSFRALAVTLFIGSVASFGWGAWSSVVDFKEIADLL